MSATLQPSGYNLATWEKYLVEVALRDAKGNKTAAAKTLGIGRSTMHRKLRQYKISVPATFLEEKHPE